jgi:hypothetical protein
MEMVVLLVLSRGEKKNCLGAIKIYALSIDLTEEPRAGGWPPGGWPAHRQLQGCAHTGGESRIPSGPLWMYFFRGYHGKTQEVVNLSTV